MSEYYCDTPKGEECKKPLSSYEAVKEHKLKVHNSFKDGKEINSTTEKQIKDMEEKVTWLLKNRKGCTGSDTLLNKWYEADFLNLYQYNGITKRFRPLNVDGESIEEVLARPNPETIIRARAKIQEKASKRIEEAISKNQPPNPEDLRLLPSDLTLLKRRKREAVYHYVMAHNQGY